MTVSTMRRTRPPEPRVGVSTEDGDLVITRAELERFGNGDARAARKEIRAMLMAEVERKVPQGPTERPKSVRFATIHDEPAVFELVMAEMREVAEPVAPISEDKVIELIKRGTRGKLGFVGVIDGPDGVPVAVSVLVADQWAWSQQYLLQSIIHYVHPDHRKSHHIDALLQFEAWLVDEWSKTWGYRVHLLSSVMSTRRIRSKMLLWERKFTRLGAFFIYPPPQEA